MATRTFRASAPLALLGYSRENFPPTLIATGDHVSSAGILIRCITASMTSLKRSVADPYTSNISSKVFVRSTKNGKVQKVVRELYLRQDIPCSSRLCAACLAIAPGDANGVGTLRCYVTKYVAE